MSSHNTVKPIGGVAVRRVIEPPDPDDRLLEQILSRSNMHESWQRVKANKAAPGVDHVAMAQGMVSVKELWVNIHYPATAR